MMTKSKSIMVDGVEYVKKGSEWLEKVTAAAQDKISVRWWQVFGAMVLIVLFSGVLFYTLGANDASRELAAQNQAANQAAERSVMASKGLAAAYDYSAAYALVFLAQHIGVVLGALWIVLLIHGFKVVGR